MNKKYPVGDKISGIREKEEQKRDS